MDSWKLPFGAFWATWQGATLLVSGRVYLSIFMFWNGDISLFFCSFPFFSMIQLVHFSEWSKFQFATCSCFGEAGSLLVLRCLAPDNSFGQPDDRHFFSNR